MSDRTLSGVVQPYLYEPLGRFTDYTAVLFHAREEGKTVGVRWESPNSPEYRYKVVEVADHHFVGQAVRVNTDGVKSLGNEEMFRIGDVFSVALMTMAGSAEARGGLDMSKYKDKDRT
jgi:hypothetical protein